MSLPAPCRVARVMRTGRRYLVVSEDAVRGRVYCAGEVLAVSGASTRHGRQKTFRLSDVEIVECDRTEGLLNELLEQGRAC